MHFTQNTIFTTTTINQNLSHMLSSSSSIEIKGSHYYISLLALSRYAISSLGTFHDQFKLSAYMRMLTQISSISHPRLHWWDECYTCTHTCCCNMYCTCHPPTSTDSSTKPFKHATSCVAKGSCWHYGAAAGICTRITLVSLQHIAWTLLQVGTVMSVLN